MPGEPRLAIDYGTASTVAVLAWPDGRWLPVSFDGSLTLPSAVHSSGQNSVLVGADAWRHAAAAPDGFVAAPLRAGTDALPAGDTKVEVADLVAATLRHVAAEATRLVGAPVVDVRLVVPAGWGPRRRTWLRQAAYRAGLGQPRLVEAPVAAADRLLAVGVPVPVGALLLVCDLGAGCEATVLRRGPADFEVLSTMADPHAGGAQIDETLVATLLGADVDALSGGVRWTVLQDVRAAKETLARQPVVTMPLPAPAPPMVVNSTLVDDAARPVLQNAAELASRALTAADVTVESLAGIYCIGGTAVLPAASAIIGERLATVALPVAQPDFAAVLGAADAGTATADGTAIEAPTPLPPLRRLAGLALPAMASLAVYAHFMTAATFNNGTPTRQSAHYYVLASWGELATAALFALVACLTAGSLFGVALTYADRHHHKPSRAGERIAGGIALAATAGVAIAGLYAVVAAVTFGQSVAGPLRWALLPILPMAVCAAGVAWLAGRRSVAPGQGWDAFLAFPVSSVIIAGLGTVLVAYWAQSPIPPGWAGWADTVGRLGGLLIGVGVACTLVRPVLLRLVLAAPLAVFGIVVVGPGSTGILAVVYAIAATLWWGQRLWSLIRTPSAAPGHAG